MTNLEVNILYLGKTQEHFIIIVDGKTKLTLSVRQAKGLIKMIEGRLKVIEE